MKEQVLIKVENIVAKIEIVHYVLKSSAAEAALNIYM